LTLRRILIFREEVLSILRSKHPVQEKRFKRPLNKGELYDQLLSSIDQSLLKVKSLILLNWNWFDKSGKAI